MLSPANNRLIQTPHSCSGSVLRNPASMDDEGWARVANGMSQLADLDVWVAVYDENSSAAPFAEIIVTKNRFGSLGTVYQRFCNGHFVACDQDEARQICTASNAPAARGRRYAQGADV